MDSREILEILSHSHLFSELTDEQMDRVRRHAHITDMVEGESLFFQGDEAICFYLVVSGRIKLFRVSPDGKEKVVEIMESGATFAEALMFFEQTTYPVSAAAMKDSTVVSISTKRFLNILKSSTDTSLMILGDLSRRLHELVNEIENLSLLTGRNRMATYFLDQTLNKGAEFKLEIPKYAIASMLSLKPETFSRLLKELCKMGVLEVDDSTIRILDQDKLRQQAGIV